jgi:hypothetical protein
VGRIGVVTDVGESGKRRGSLAGYKNSVSLDFTTPRQRSIIADETVFAPLVVAAFVLPRQDLARQVAYLKEENRILRARLPEKLVTTEKERTRLMKVGRKLGDEAAGVDDDRHLRDVLQMGAREGSCGLEEGRCQAEADTKARPTTNRRSPDALEQTKRSGRSSSNSAQKPTRATR